MQILELGQREHQVQHARAAGTRRSAIMAIIDGKSIDRAGRTPGGYTRTQAAPKSAPRICPADPSPSSTGSCSARRRPRSGIPPRPRRSGTRSAPAKSISPDAMPRVPSFSFSRRSAKPLGAPSSTRGIAKHPRPRVPARPSHAGRHEDCSASATEQNHFSPDTTWSRRPAAARRSRSRRRRCHPAPRSGTANRVAPARSRARATTAGTARRNLGSATHRNARARPIVHTAGHTWPTSPSSESR